MTKMLPKPFSLLLKSYITDRQFRVKVENATTSLKKINTGVPQGSVLGPVLYLLYTSDVPSDTGVTLATFADDTAILAADSKIEASPKSCKLQ